jgi:hypothetical protein
VLLDGAPVEILTEPDDVRGHLALLGSGVEFQRDVDAVEGLVSGV